MFAGSWMTRCTVCVAWLVGASGCDPSFDPEWSLASELPGMDADVDEEPATQPEAAMDAGLASSDPDGSPPADAEPLDGAPPTPVYCLCEAGTPGCDTTCTASCADTSCGPSGSCTDANLCYRSCMICNTAIPTIK